jgi:predicted ATP-grasp superfamily ATP-dependent carboligase
MGAGKFDVPAVVVGLNPTGLGLVRSLVPHCRRVIALESDRTEPGARTRLCEVRWVADLADHDRLRDSLFRVAEDVGGKPVLFFSSDEHVVWATHTRAALDGAFRTLLPDREVCEELMFKDRFAALAAREGVPVPRGAFLPVDTLAAGVAAAELRYPLVLKPKNKSGAWERRGLPKAFIARTRAEVDDVGRRVRRVVREILVQEYLEGGDDRVFFCLYLGAPALGEPVLFCGRKLLQWPPLRGSTAACEPASAPDLEAFTRGFFGRLGLEGFASLEVKYAPDGSFRIIEPTVGRPDLQSGVATINGFNMTMAAYLAAQDRGDEARAFVRAARNDVAWLYESSLWALLRTRALDLSSLLRLAWRRKRFALASWSDPAVLSTFAWQRLASFLRRQFPAATAAISGAPRTPG